MQAPWEQYLVNTSSFPFHSHASLQSFLSVQGMTQAAHNSNNKAKQEMPKQISAPKMTYCKSVTRTKECPLAFCICFYMNNPQFTKTSAMIAYAWIPISLVFEFLFIYLHKNKRMLLRALQPGIYAHLLEVNCNMSIICSFLNFDL